MAEPAEKKARIHYGSLEEEEKLRAQNPAALTASAAPNVFRGDAKNIMALSEESQGSNRAHMEILKELERKKRARNLALPTEDGKVKLMLRELGHPICMFGELPHQRRDRLRELLSKLNDEQLEAFQKEESSSEEEEEITEEFYTPGSEELLKARMDITRFSLPRAKHRIQMQRAEQERNPAELQAERNEVANKLKKITNSCSQIGEDRPLAFCRLTGDSRHLVTGAWNGALKSWSLPDAKMAFSWRGHEQRIGAIDFHPDSCRSLDPSAANMVTCAADGKVFLWSMTSPDPVGELVGHKQRVARVAYHPSGRYIGTTSYDSSWRLWDTATSQELLLQEGHFNEIYGISFHTDGSLVATSGLDAYGRIWDLRSGRSIFVLEGHVKQVLAIDFSPNGYLVATGSDDNSIKIWDLRKRKCTYTIPAHQNLVSHLKFEPEKGNYLVSSSFDNTLRLWSSVDWRPIKTLAGHENKVLCADISHEKNFVASWSYDRTFKLWEPSH